MAEGSASPQSAEVKVIKQTSEIKETRSTPAPAQDSIVETKHSVGIGGQEIKYTAHTGTLVLHEEPDDRDKEFEGEKARARIFFVSYTKDGVQDQSKRPITFCFNGGPGSSSVWLHLGLLGPRRVLLEDEGQLPQPPFRLVDNAYSLLDETDLVLIDPVSTGYSRPVEGHKAREWHGFKKDISSVGDFIRLYATRYNRWLSPKFLIGESYGSTRAAGLAGYLQERHGMYFNGLMLVSAALDFTAIDFQPNNDLPYILFLPGYAAAAWYHKKLKRRRPLRPFLAEVESFAAGQYAEALLRGDALPKARRKEIVEALAGYTGISPEFIDRCNLRMNDQHFFKELLRDRGQTIGRLDCRFLGRDRVGVTDEPEYDPLITAVAGPYTAGLYDYVRSELNFQADRSYEIMTDFVLPWSYPEFEGKFVYVGETLRSAMTQNPYLKVFVASGLFDLGTPYSATDYVINHLGLHESLRKNISTGTYEAGHMMYIHLPSLTRLKADLRRFIRSSMPE
ncbi:MAG: S10 family peptidase [Anaerolineales bacterium]